MKIWESTMSWYNKCFDGFVPHHVSTHMKKYRCGSEINLAAETWDPPCHSSLYIRFPDLA